jgi:hypothetical protein
LELGFSQRETQRERERERERDPDLQLRIHKNSHLAGLEAEVLGAREWILELSMLWQSNQSQ